MKTKASFYFLSLLFVGYSLISCGQDKSSRPSPPAKASSEIAGATVEINYSQPAVKGREVWGNLVPYGKVWRTGANEATTIEFSKDVMIEGQPLKAGKYALFTIPNKDEWVVIFNSTWEQWGAYQYDSKKDALRVSVKPKMESEMVEHLKFEVNESSFSMNWEKLSFSVVVSN